MAANETGAGWGARRRRDQLSTVVSAGDELTIMIYGPKPDSTYEVEFQTADDEVLSINVPASETRVLKHFQAACLTGCSSRTFRNRV
jgi:hypothetical protein